MRGEALRYRTTAPVTLWPIEVENIRLTGLPIVAPANPAATGAVAALRITLKCAVPEMTFAQLGVDRLRFFLQGPSNQTLPLYELLGGHVLSVAFADSADRRQSGHRACGRPCNPPDSATTKRCCRGRRAALPASAC